MDNDLELLKPKVMAYLKDYLIDMGVEITDKGNDSWICCLNPEHDDRNPSMHFVPGQNETILKCFSCQANYNIFHVANILENKGMSGKEFVYDNLYYLCDKYGIEYEKKKLTEQELRELEARKAYRDAAKVFTKLCLKDKDFSFTHTRARGISDTIAAGLGVGTIYWDNFKEEMKALGYEEQWLEGIDIGPDFIGLDYMTFLLRDHKGDCVGLARRWMNWNKKDGEAARAAGQHYMPKYKNTSGTKNPAYNKSQFLYGLYKAVEARTSKIDLVEGYTDVIAMMQAGHSHVAAVCGTAVTKQQVQLLKDLGFTNINLTLDADDAGIANMDKHLDAFKSTPGVRTTITVLEFADEVAQEDRDPCYWIQIHGLDEYFDLKRKTAFDWQLEKLIAQKIPFDEIAKSMVDYILAESSAIDREVLVKELSRRTGISRDAIQEEIDNRTNSSVDKTVNDAVRRLSHVTDAREKIELLKEAAQEAENSVADYGRTDLSVAASYATIESITSDFMKDTPGLTGWDCGIENINKNFGGIPKSKELIGFAGNPNTGKSTLLYNIAYGLMNNNPEGLTCAFWSLDDPVEAVIAKMLAIKTGFNINQCKHAGNMIPGHNMAVKDDNSYKDAVAWIKDMVRGQRFLTQSTSMGETIDACEKWIRSIKDETGNDIVLFIDSFHNISGGGDDERIKAKRASEWMQKISDVLDLTIICTMECNKQAQTSKKPRIEHLGESGKMAFSFKLLGMVYNDLHENRERAKSYWIDGERKRPVIEVAYEKNKITSYKGTNYFKFYDDQAKLEEISFEEMQQMRQQEHQDRVQRDTGIPNVNLFDGGDHGVSSIG